MQHFSSPIPHSNELVTNEQQAKINKPPLTPLTISISSSHSSSSSYSSSPLASLSPTMDNSMFLRTNAIRFIFLGMLLGATIAITICTTLFFSSSSSFSSTTVKDNLRSQGYGENNALKERQNFRRYNDFLARYTNDGDKIQTGGQRIIFLAGPHKTGSTSIQHNVMEWSNRKILGNWVWSAPPDDAGPFASLDGGKGKKVFGPLLNIIGGRVNNSRNVPDNDEDRTEMVRIYRETLREDWVAGRNVVFGSEGGDFILSKNIDRNDFVGRLKAILPWSPDGGVGSGHNLAPVPSDYAPLHGDDSRLTVVITYRSPRIDHFISCWHMYANPPDLRSWILDHWTTDMHLLDPLGMAKAYADAGFDVVLIDSGGARSAGVDLTLAVTCGVMGAPCEGGMLLGDPGPPVPRNVLPEYKVQQEHVAKSMTDKELRQIDEVLKTFDYRYGRDILSNPKISILYGQELLQTLASCSYSSTSPHCSKKKKKRKSREWMREEIKAIAQDGLGNVQVRWNSSFYPARAFYVDIRDPNHYRWKPGSWDIVADDIVEEEDEE